MSDLRPSAIRLQHERKPAYSSAENQRASVYLRYILVAFLVLAWSVAFYQQPLELFLTLNKDDAFYYYQISRNFAHGQFSTFDGVNITNGYHPVWSWMLVPVFLVFQDPVAALRASKMLEFMLLLASTCLSMEAGRAAGWHVLTLLILPIWIFSQNLFFSGMEAAPQVLALALFLFLFVALAKDWHRGAAWLGLSLVCAVLPWVRLECLAVSLMGAAFVTAWAWCRGQKLGLPVATVWAGALGGTLLYFVVSEIVFGTATPVSGQIKNYWSSLRFAQQGGYDLIKNSLPILKADLFKTSLLAPLIIAISWAVPSYRHAAYRTDHAIDFFLLILLCEHAARILYSVAFLHPLYDAPWYYVPGRFVQILFLPLAVNRGFLLARLLCPAFAAQQRRTEVLIAGTSLMGAALIANPLSAFRDWTSANRQVSSWTTASYQGTIWMNDHLPAGSVIGSPDSGIVGYFSRHRVVNLDGLVNSKPFFSAVQSQSVEAWMRGAGVTHLANGVEADAVDGCAYMAKASVQARPYRGPCKLLYEGTLFDETFGGVNPMRFRVFAFGERDR